MKKIFALLLALSMVLALAACGNTQNGQENQQSGSNAQSGENQNQEEQSGGEDVAVMSYEEYMAAELDSAVTV